MQKTKLILKAKAHGAYNKAKKVYMAKVKVRPTLVCPSPLSLPNPPPPPFSAITRNNRGVIREMRIGNRTDCVMRGTF